MHDPLQTLGFASGDPPHLARRASAQARADFGVVDAEAELAARRDAIGALQERMITRKQQALLVVLQGMDAAGKDSTTKAVFTGVNPLGIRAVAFGPPSIAELRHDFLWRVHAELPPRGAIGVFNRSHYEDPVFGLVHGGLDRAGFERQLRDIAAFERSLVDNGTTVIKIFLHLGRDEQRRRLQERIDNPHKHWKFDPSDLRDRALWQPYQQAYETALQHTQHAHAPWWVVPADDKPLRNLLVARLVERALIGMDLRHADAKPELRGLRVD